MIHSSINSLIHFCWPSHHISHKLDICAFIQIFLNICSTDKLKHNSTNVPRYNNIWTLRSKIFVKLYCRKIVCITHHAVLDWIRIATFSSQCNFPQQIHISRPFPALMYFLKRDILYFAITSLPTNLLYSPKHCWYIFRVQPNIKYIARMLYSMV